MSQQSPQWMLLALATGTASVGVLIGVTIAGPGRRIRRAIPLSAGILLGVAVFGLLPELAQDLSWTRSLLTFGAGFLLLTVLDRAGVSICPDCSHDHDHGECAAPLHGFATPLLIAAALHSVFDGWAIGTAGGAIAGGFRISLPLALVLHKLPEGFSLGAILRGSVRSRTLALGLAILAEALTLAGGWISLSLAPAPGTAWASYPLAVAGGFFLFLAFHALHGEWKKSPVTTMWTGALGLGISAGLQSGLRGYLGS